MGLIIYFVRGLVLLRYLLSPSYRRNTKARWKLMRHPAIVREVTTGIVGLFILGALLFLLFFKLTSKINE